MILFHFFKKKIRKRSKRIKEAWKCKLHSKAIVLRSRAKEFCSNLIITSYGAG